MQSYADRRFAMVASGIADAFWMVPLVTRSGAERWAALGLADATARYFAWRSAPLGRVPAELVTSTFFGFHRSKVERYVPAVWERTSPEEVWDTLVAVTDVALRDALGDWLDTPDAAEAATLLREAAQRRAGAAGGRPLFAAHAARPWSDPADLHLVIWQACVLLREYRGDSHIAVLVADGIDACECHLLLAAAAVGGCSCHALLARLGVRPQVDAPPDPTVGTDREWPVPDRRAAAARLRERGILDADHAITPHGMDVHERLEEATDRASAHTDDREDVQRVAELLAEPVRRLRTLRSRRDATR